MIVSGKIKCFFVVFGMVYFLESIGGFYMTTAVVFIEKQFQIPSRLSGTMVSAGDFAYIPVVIFTSYFGGKGNRAKWIAGGCILIAIANFLIASSNFLFPVAEFDADLANVPKGLVADVRWVAEKERTGNNGSNFFVNEVHPTDIRNVKILTALPYAFCSKELNDIRNEQTEGECNANPPSMGPFIMIFCGLLMLGVGRTMPFSLGLPLIDDNVKKANLPMYFAMMFFCKILGPVLGLVVGGQLNSVYYTLNPPQGLTPLDPAWIGCWWMGFIIFGAVLLFPSIALFFFPTKSIIDSQQKNDVALEPLNGKDEKHKETFKLNLVDKHKKEEIDGMSAMDEFKGLLSSIFALLKLPIFVGAMIGRVIDTLASKGFMVFLSKYLQLQFGIPQHRIQQYIAFMGILGFACGIAAGSLAMKKLKLQGRRAAVWVAAISAISAAFSFSYMFIGCESVTAQLAEQGRSTNFTFAACDSSCSCKDAPMYPVCSREGELFYSPCHAGCPLTGKMFSVLGNEEESKTDPLVFGGCKCAGGDQVVSRSFCVEKNCENRFYLYFAVACIGAFIGGLGLVPGMLIILRSVPPDNRSVSLGFSGFIVSLFATLPSPVVWGQVFDRSCLHWPTYCGDRRAACQLYDTTELRHSIYFFNGSLRVISLLTDAWVVYWAKGLLLTDELPEPTEEVSPNRKHSRKLTATEFEARVFEEEALHRTV